MTDKEALTQLFGEHSGWRIIHTFKMEDGYDMYTVIVDRSEKPKRYVLPMPDGLEGESWRAMHIAIREKDEGWYGSAYHYDITASETPSYTQADIDAAPDWVKAITPVEVTDDE